MEYIEIFVFSAYIKIKYSIIGVRIYESYCKR
jgi:hypothetical protein